MRDTFMITGAAIAVISIPVFVARAHNKAKRKKYANEASELFKNYTLEATQN